MKKTEPLTGRRSEGLASKQAHTQLPKGTYEREIGRDGFFGPATMMYHQHPPTGWVDWEGPLRPRAFDLNSILSSSPELIQSDVFPERDEHLPFDAPIVLSNQFCAIQVWHCGSPMRSLVRNADGDQLLFIHAGEASLYCDYGFMKIKKGDYIVLPRGTMWRLSPKTSLSLLMIEARGNLFQLPDKGILGHHAIFDPALLESPTINDEFKAQQTQKSWAVYIKHRDLLSRVRYEHNPLDAVGWQGNLMPVKLNISDIRPVMSHRYHLPPSAHTTFVAQRFVVCSFVPRPFETDETAIKIPFFHNNDDYDEVIFYHAGDFFSRDKIAPGMMTFHPAGFTHGPHPGALKNMLKQTKPATDEYAVMIDARDPLLVGSDPRIERSQWHDYVKSWQVKKD